MNCDNKPIESIPYRGMDIDIYLDDNPENPFEAWSGEPPLIVITYERSKQRTDYKGEQITDYVASRLTDNYVLRNQRTLYGLTCSTYYSYTDMREYTKGWTASERAEYIREEILEWLDEDLLNNLEEMCTLLKIPHLRTSTRGHIQGDWAGLFFAWTPEWGAETGVKTEAAVEQFKASAELFSAWAWGHVYGYTVDAEGYNDSCWGFYGDDHEKSGLLDMARGEIDAYFEHLLRTNIAQRKEQIKHRVPLHYRN